MTTHEQGRASIVDGRYKFEGPFHHIHPITPIMDEDGILHGITVRFDMSYVRTYGGEAQFFAAIQKGRLLATRCDNEDCSGHGQIMMPFRVHCMDCLEKATVVDMTDVANTTAKVHTHVTNSRTGAFNRLETPIYFISVEMDGVCTMPMGYLLCGEPTIGMRIRPIFKTENPEPSYVIIELAWVPDGTDEADLPEGWTFSLPVDDDADDAELEEPADDSNAVTDDEPTEPADDAGTDEGIEG